MTKKYKGDKINKESGTAVASTAMASLKPEYNVITSSTEQIRKTRSEKNLANGKMAVDVLTYGTKMYVD